MSVLSIFRQAGPCLLVVVFVTICKPFCPEIGDKILFVFFFLHQTSAFPFFSTAFMIHFAYHTSAVHQESILVIFTSK